VNTHISELDTETIASEFWIDDTTRQVNYNRIYDGNTQAIFDKKLRERMGLTENGTEWIDIESYDRAANTISYIDDEGVRHTTDIDGGLSIDMFTPEELLTQAGGYASAYGFDYYGNKLDSKVSMEDFINGTTTETINGSEVTYQSMLQDAIRPVYMAGYIQDKFAFRDLIFNVGVRVDRFDANHPVLNDPYLLYDAYTAGEASDFTHPSNIGDDYVVYVDDMLSSDKVITGYRNGNTWYAADGTEISGDPATLLDKGNGVQPYLVDAQNQDLSTDAFGDYEPQINIMPRVAFSFPISDEALFFAHYDVLTQRPTANWTFNPTSYFFWPIRGVDQINNPDLNPEKTIDYEIGFQQKLSNTSSLKIAAFYREVRDQIQAYRFTEAYPKTYYGYSNIDFGTIKGLTVTYDLRRTNNIRLKAAYTLQFAKGTGSDANTQLNLIRAGLPNLRTLLPTANDQRHAFNVNFDYRYGAGKKYDGPSTTRKLADGTTKNVNWLENTGLNITFWGGSGTPYTKYTGTGDRAVIDGSPYGARLPYTYRFDARLDRDFFIGSGKEDGRSTYLNVYVQVLNVFNTKNILSVYGTTGVPDDDGYLADDTWESIINSYVDPVAYREMYSLNRNRYWNYSSPRQIRVGMSLNF
jgi:outer membrane receptor protein involved in Fe transport